LTRRRREPSSEIRLSLPAPLPRATSRRGKIVARWFGLNHTPPAHDAPVHTTDAHPLQTLIPLAGTILLITGASGAGKSSLLRAIRTQIDAEKSSNADWMDLDRLTLPSRALVDCFGKIGLEQAMQLLNRVGLSEAWTYLRKPAELSDGQRWRLRLAIGLHQARQSGRPQILACDEFAALLDRVTAAVVAHALRRVISRDGRLAAIVATSHDDLLDALEPDTQVHCDFGSATVVRRRKSAA
jgi:ABC-type ATPase with predicted acetyltransferase domain